MSKTILVIGFLIGLTFIFCQSAVANTNLTLTVSGTPHCSDGIDNDNDTLIDYPDDSGCGSLLDENEIDPPAEPEPEEESGGGGTSGGGGGGGGTTATTPSGNNSSIFSGYAYPGSLVSIIQNGKIVATTQAGPNAKFEIQISNLVAGNYTFGINAVDKDSNQSIMQSFTIAVSNGITTVVSGIFLPPTIFADKQEVKRGDNITFFGQAPPQAKVSVVVNSETEIIKNVLADNLTGAWLLRLNTLSLEYGEHSARAKAESETDVSEMSKIYAFKVSNQNVVAILKENREIIGDLNKDGRVNLTDFSIAAFWYGKNKPKVGDVNDDGKVNLVDMSIMAYYWTG